MSLREQTIQAAIGLRFNNFHSTSEVRHRLPAAPMPCGAPRLPLWPRERAALVPSCCIGVTGTKAAGVPLPSLALSPKRAGLLVPAAQSRAGRRQRETGYSAGYCMPHRFLEGR